MRTLLLDRFTAWICLTLVLLTGLTPTQGFVLCIEADGCVSVEVKTAAGDCDGCEGHDEEVGLTVLKVEDSSDPAECLCIDIAFPGSRDDQVARGRSVEVQLGPTIAPPEAVRIAPALRVLADRRGPPHCVPRVAESLAHIRSVVLLV